MYKALVLILNEKTREVGSLLAVARAEACKREQTNTSPPILALMFVSEFQVYVALYAAQDVQKPEVKKLSG